MKRCGSLYVFEGPDGVGKTTLSKWFADILNTRFDRRTVWSSFPGSEHRTVGDLVYRLHHDPAALGVDGIRPLSLQLMHVAAHVDAIETRFKKLLRHGTSIVLDRFWWSTWVYGKCAGVDEAVLDAAIEVEKLVWGRLKPERVFLILRPSLQQSPSHRRITRCYSQLAQREQRRVSVQRIRNNGPLAHTQEIILSSAL